MYQIDMICKFCKMIFSAHVIMFIVETLMYKHKLTFDTQHVFRRATRGAEKI